MKAIVRRELESEDYRVLAEPLFPPSDKISWSRYRPDLLAYRAAQGHEEVAIVECETHPNMKRFGRKNHSSLWFQPFLFHGGTIRRILAVPQGKLGSVDLKLRSRWEVWVIGGVSPMCKIGVKEGARDQRERWLTPTTSGAGDSQPI